MPVEEFDVSLMKDCETQINELFPNNEGFYFNAVDKSCKGIVQGYADFFTSLDDKNWPDKDTKTYCVKSKFLKILCEKSR